MSCMMTWQRRMMAVYGTVLVTFHRDITENKTFFVALEQKVQCVATPLHTSHSATICAVQ